MVILAFEVNRLWSQEAAVIIVTTPVMVDEGILSLSLEVPHFLRLERIQEIQTMRVGRENSQKYKVKKVANVSLAAAYKWKYLARIEANMKGLKVVWKIPVMEKSELTTSYGQGFISLPRVTPGGPTAKHLSQGRQSRRQMICGVYNPEKEK